MKRGCIHKWMTKQRGTGPTYARCVKCPARRVWTFKDSRTKTHDAGPAVTSMVTGAVAALE